MNILYDVLSAFQINLTEQIMFPFPLFFRVRTCWNYFYFVFLGRFCIYFATDQFICMQMLCLNLFCCFFITGFLLLIFILQWLSIFSTRFYIMLVFYLTFAAYVLRCFYKLLILVFFLFILICLTGNMFI